MKSRLKTQDARIKEKRKADLPLRERRRHRHHKEKRIPDFTEITVIVVIMLIPLLCWGQFDKFKYVPKVNIDNSWSGENTFSGEVTMVVVTVDTVNYTYQVGTAVVADSIILGLNKELMLDDDGDTYIVSGADDNIDIYAGDGLDFIFSANRFAANISYGPTLLVETASATNPVFSFASDVDLGMSRAGADSLSIIAGGRAGIYVAEANSLVSVYIPDGHVVLMEQASLPAAPFEGSIVKTDGDSLLVYVNGAWMNITTEARATP